jgi:hypothetical protein
MKLPKLDKPDKYTGLYVVDFGEYCSTGYTAREVAELLESEKYKHSKVYKIHKAYPDGRLELKGVPSQRFQLETGMFFYSIDEQTAKTDFERLVQLAEEQAPPCRAKVHLAKDDEAKFVVAIIYPAEYDDEISSWLLDGKYRTAGTIQGGTGPVQMYYDQSPQILDRRQLFPKDALPDRTGEELFARTKIAVQR